MARKLLGRLTATCTEDGVKINTYKTTPAFQDSECAPLFREIRVYRKEEADFTFGQDYEEYFHGLPYDRADLIFQGPLEAINDRKYEYVDRDVRVGGTYGYWIAAAEGEPAGPVAVRVRHRQVWWPYETVIQRLRGLEARHPSTVTLAEIGRSVQDRPLYGVTIGASERRVALVGLVHAGESGPELFIPAAERLIAEQPALLSSVGLAIVPSVNVDEREREVAGVPWYLRVNANGVDINRNFDVQWDQVELGYGLVSSDPTSATYRGPRVESEPETRAVSRFLEKVRPVALFSYHALSSLCGFSYLMYREVEKDEAHAREGERLAKAYAKGMWAEFENDRYASFGTSAGSLPAWCYEKLGVPAFDIEMSGEVPEDRSAAREDRVTLELLERYQDMHYRGIVSVLQLLTESR